MDNRVIMRYMKNFVLGGVILLVIGAIGWGAYRMGQSQKVPTVSPTPSGPSVSVQPIVGGDKDEHGCIGSAGYAWCEAKNKCIRQWEEPCDTAPATNEDIAEAIKQALIKKNNWSSDISIAVTITKREGIYASGGVKETGTEGGGGGYVFAVYDNNEWKIVADGNGVITCESIAPYPSYPVSMIPECWDTKTERTQAR